MNIISTKNINKLFYIALILAVIIFMLPIEYRMGVYTPNIIGYLLVLVILPLILISYLYSIYLDIIRKNGIKHFVIRTILLAISIALVFWFSSQIN